MRRTLTGLLILWCTAQALAQTLSTSKISAHFISDYSVGSSNIVYGRPQTLKVLGLDSGWPAGMVSAMRDYKAKAPSGKLVVRIYSPKLYSLSDDATWAAGDFWTNILKKSLDYLSSSDRALIDYLEGPNEGQTPTLGYPPESALQASHWFNQFWTNLTPRIVAAGYKPCIGSIAVGNPGGDVPAHLGIFAPALRQAKAAGGAWSYHAYTIHYSTDIGVEYWYSLRYRQFYQIFASNLPDLTDMPLILTEGGVDETGNPNTSGWRARGTAADYQRWLNWFDSEMQKDSYVMGCTLFQNGDPSGWWSFELEPIGSWLRDYLLPPQSVPPAPSGLAALSGMSGLTISWTNPPLHPTTWTIRRATNSAGPFWIVATSVNTGARSTSFLDSAAAPGVDYFYRVTGVNALGEGSPATLGPVRLSQPFPSAINSGGGAVGAYLDDVYFDGGTAYTTSTVVNTNGVASPAPAAVYQSQRYGNCSYRLKTGTSLASYRLRLHFAEIWWTAPGQRVFDVLVNGATVLENLDIYSAAAGAFKAVVREFNVMPNAAGEVSLQLISKVDNASINAIELMTLPTNSIPAVPTGLSATVGNALVSLKWDVPAGATSCNVKRATLSGGPYTIIASNVVSAAYQDPSFSPLTTYYYVVSAVSPAGQSANSSYVPARPTNGLPDVVITGAGWSPATLSNGTQAVFWSRVMNRGSAATPSGIVLGVGFNMDGAATVAWSGNYKSSLLPNNSVVLTADGGPTGNYWTATRGHHTLIATVDDINRFPESMENNNGYGTNLYVHSPKPVITSLSKSNSSAVVSWKAIAGAPYVLQSATNIGSLSWESADPMTAASTNASAVWPGFSGRRFFRVLQYD